MIDELVKVANAMAGAKIVPIDWHDKLVGLPKASKYKPCIRIWLTSDGHIKELESLGIGQAALLRKYEPDLGRSLPGFNVRPLFRQVRSFEEIQGKKLEKDLIELLKKGYLDWSLFLREEDDFWAKTRDGLTACFGRVREQLEKACSSRLNNDETLAKFLKTVSKIDIETFQGEYTAAVKYKIQQGELPFSLLCYFVTEEKKRKEDTNSRAPVPKISVFLDIVDYSEYPVAHERTMIRLNKLLWEKDKETIPDNNEEDAYGLDSKFIEEKFPRVTVPILGGVILRSQVKTIPAQMRYHRCESITFPVGAETKKRIRTALEWIADPERDGETYGIAGDRELLFAYPRILPRDKVPIAKMFGAQPDISLGEVKFERIANSVITQLKGLGISAAEAELEIFFLRKMDKARTKVVYYRNVSVELLERASGIWSEGCQNIPLLDVWDWSEERDENTGKLRAVKIDSASVFPIKLHRYLNTIWKRSGDHAGKVKIFEPADGLTLLLGEQQCIAQAAYMMERFVQHSQGYFLFLCRGTGKREITKLPDKIYYPGILGLLLLKLGKGKDEYMKENAFLLGRFLRIADEIHRLYCEVVRDNDLPPELCGSSLLVGMMESPGRTMHQLAMRSAPYVKWARAYVGQDKAGLVHFWMQQWAIIADQLHLSEWPKRLPPEERAQVFLGYLASFPKNQNQ
ncbi:hypothetical protein JW979_12165 [bacterium]|nr:hypothetical protein [candidate division CSSED10-310 bacterium]